MNLRSVHGAESVSIASSRATAEITLTGGHIAPVTFVLGDREVRPYSLPPWQPHRRKREQHANQACVRTQRLYAIGAAAVDRAELFAISAIFDLLEQPPTMGTGGGD